MSDMAEDRDLLAAEYVLGTLSPEEARAARTRAEADPSMAAAIEAWQARLSPLAAAVAPVPPPPALWERIAADLGRDTPPALPIEAERASNVVRLWRSPRAWRAATAASLALAASLAGIIVLRTPQPAVMFVASLAPLNAPQPAFLARLQPGGAVELTALEQVPVASGKDLELWLLPPGATAPKSLGVLPAQGKRFTLPAAPPANSKLLVSLEPAGGSPTGQPTGPVLYGGAVTQLN